ncbi:MAG: type II secretion system F family protein [Deltaproteobacteria bacterium]|nr:type II secretion system F family protein [Deltaproteobacteria bacterium]
MNIFNFFSPISLEDKYSLAIQLGNSTDAGLPIISALNSTISECGNRRLNEVLQNIRRDLKRGISLSVAFSKHPNLFSEFYVSMVESGEGLDELAQAFYKIANLIEKDIKGRRNAISTIIYPLIFGTAAAGILFYLFAHLIPEYFK